MMPIIAAAFDVAWIVAVVGLIGGAGGAIVAFRKAGSESSAILVDAAKDVVIIQRDALNELKLDMATMSARITELEAQRSRMELEVIQLRKENADLKTELATFKKTNGFH